MRPSNKSGCDALQCGRGTCKIRHIATCPIYLTGKSFAPRPLPLALVLSIFFFFSLPDFFSSSSFVPRPINFPPFSATGISATICKTINRIRGTNVEDRGQSSKSPIFMGSREEISNSSGTP